MKMIQKIKVIPLSILRWLGMGFVHLIFYALGLFIPTFIYLWRDTVRAWKEQGNSFGTFLWYFINDTEANPNNPNDIDWGDYGRYPKNYFGFFMQCSIRNSHWNARKHLFGFKPFSDTAFWVWWGRLYNVKTKEWVKGSTQLCNVNNYWGTQCCFYYGDKIPLFRFSFSIPLGNRVWNVQLGEGSKRYIYKYKFSKK